MSFVFVETQFVDPAGVGGSTLPAAQQPSLWTGARTLCRAALPALVPVHRRSVERTPGCFAGYGEGHAWKWRATWDPHF